MKDKPKKDKLLYCVSALRLYEDKFFTKEMDALKEAKEESSKMEYKDILFFVHEVLPNSQKIIAGFENGILYSGVDLGEV